MKDFPAIFNNDAHQFFLSHEITDDACCFGFFYSYCHDIGERAFFYQLIYCIVANAVNYSCQAPHIVFNACLNKIT